VSNEIKSYIDYPMIKIPGGEIEYKSPNSFDGDLKPVVNISWNDAISFCNLLSQKAGLNECYSVSNDGENIICDWESDGYRLPSEAEWQYACKAGTTGYRYGELDQIAWYDENSGGKIFFEEVAGLKRPGLRGFVSSLQPSVILHRRPWIPSCPVFLTSIFNYTDQLKSRNGDEH
jgi:hypothetical protein